MQVFGNLGVDFAAWALFSFTLAAFLGVLLRRAVAATALSLAVTTVLDTVNMMALRQHLVTPATVSGAGSLVAAPANRGHLAPGGVAPPHHRDHPPDPPPSRLNSAGKAADPAGGNAGEGTLVPGPRRAALVQ